MTYMFKNVVRVLSIGMRNTHNPIRWYWLEAARRNCGGANCSKCTNIFCSHIFFGNVCKCFLGVVEPFVSEGIFVFEKMSKSKILNRIQKCCFV